MSGVVKTYIIAERDNPDFSQMTVDGKTPRDALNRLFNKCVPPCDIRTDRDGVSHARVGDTDYNIVPAERGALGLATPL